MQHETLPAELPAELWHSVAGFLVQDSLRNLCLVSKGFRSLMQPELFRHYVQPGKSSDAFSLKPFMRVCLARPDLAAVVRKATVYDFQIWENAEVKSERKQWRRRKTTKSEWKRKYDLEIRQLRCERWPTSLVAGDAFNARTLALFCLLVPNIEHLILDLPPWSHSIAPVLNDPRTHWKLPTPFLSRLRHLQVDFEFEDDGIDLRELGSLISLSSLKTFQGHHVANDGSYENEDDSPRPLSMPRQLSIQHIHLMCSVITHGHLKELIEGCRTLKTFEIVYGEVTTGVVFKYDFEILSSAFLVHKACLESLTLDFECKSATACLGDNAIEGIMNMSSFKCLRHIDLPAWGMLRGNQNDDGDGNSGSKSISKLLPRSLESLVVRSCNEDTVAALWELLSTLDILPNLKEIAFTGEPDANLEGLDGFEDACKEKRIGLNKEK